jgi:hypothetical protein
MRNLISSKIKIIILLILLINSAAAEMKRTFPEISVNLRNEIRHDIIDYDEQKELLLLKSRSTFLIGEQFTLNYTGIKNFTDHEYLYTWYIHLSGIGDNSEIILGSYNLNFGSGLLMGRKIFVSSDPFTQRFTASREKALSPSINGNPVYSFTGAAAGIYYHGENFKISILPFLSCQERFIKPESADDGYITSSLATLNTKLYNSGGDEPVYIINYGIMGSMTLFNHFTIETFGFETDLKKADLSDMRWDAEKYGLDEGLSRMSYGGIFLQYADENISLFFEQGISRKHTDEIIDGYALMWGTAFRSGIFRFSLQGKSADTNFQADYSSGSRMPEKTWEMKSTITPVQSVMIGLTIYSRNYLLGGYNRPDIQGTLREEVTAEIKASRDLDIKFSIKSLSYYSDDYEKKKYQYIMSADHKPFNFFSHITGGMIQTYDGEESQSISHSIKLIPFSGFILQWGFSYINISRDNYIYSGVPPGSGSLSGTYRFTETGYGTAAKIAYKWNKNSVYIRCEKTVIGEKTKRKIESALNLLF